MGTSSAVVVEASNGASLSSTLTSDGLLPGVDGEQYKTTVTVAYNVVPFPSSSTLCQTCSTDIATLNALEPIAQPTFPQKAAMTVEAPTFITTTTYTVTDCPLPTVRITRILEVCTATLTACTATSFDFATVIPQTITVTANGLRYVRLLAAIY